MPRDLERAAASAIAGESSSDLEDDLSSSGNLLYSSDEELNEETLANLGDGLNRKRSKLDGDGGNKPTVALS